METYSYKWSTKIHNKASPSYIYAQIVYISLSNLQLIFLINNCVHDIIGYNNFVLLGRIFKTKFMQFKSIPTKLVSWIFCIYIPFMNVEMFGAATI